MKTMKKFLSMAALALVGATFTGCSSDDDSIIDQPQQPETKNNVVTLTTTVGFDDAAGTTRALSSTGVKTFAADEKIAVVYEKDGGTMEKVESIALTAGDISADSKSATFTVTLTDAKASGTVKYIYPAAMAGETDVDYTKLNSQDGTLDNLAANLDLAVFDGNLTSEAKLPASASLENKLAILAVTLKNETGTSEITSSITGLTLSDGTYSYSVSRSAAAGPIYVAIRPTSSANIDITATDVTKNYTKTLIGKTYAKGNGYPVSWRMTKQATVPDGAISGVFSVSGSKKVYFSKGNLRYASSKWSFFDNQYDYYTNYSAVAWDKFGWSTSATTYGMNTSTSSSTYSGDFADWGKNSELQSALGTGWFTLSSAEWTYLFNTRSASTVGGTAKGRYAKAKVNNVQGVILFPDTYTHPDGVTAPTGVNATGNTGWNGNSYTVADWTKMESAGCVFLPAAGYRTGSSVSFDGTIGFYWSATSYGSNNAYDVNFNSGDLNPANENTTRYYGFSVRLVRQVE